MKNIIMKTLISITALLGFSLSATPITDVQNYSNNTATEYFVDEDSNKIKSPYYRGTYEDWSWTHEDIEGSLFDSIVLDISAFDVDAHASSYTEIDTISVWDGLGWFGLGDLVGNDNSWGFTSFDLTNYSWAEAQVNAGLQVLIDIDAGEDGWLVTLGKSTLTIDGGSLACIPTPGVPCVNVDVPEPSTLVLFFLGLVGAAVRRRQLFIK